MPRLGLRKHTYRTLVLMRILGGISFDIGENLFTFKKDRCRDKIVGVGGELLLAAAEIHQIACQIDFFIRDSHLSTDVVSVVFHAFR